MAKVTYRARVKAAWWFKPYVYGVILTAWLTGMRPNEDKLRYWINRALKLVIEAK